MRFVFQEGAFFARCRFHGKVTFDNANLNHEAGNTPASFQGANFGQQQANFDRAQFRRADFTKACFPGGARFQGAQFHELTRFDESRFGTPGKPAAADFAAANFVGDLQFQSATLHGECSLDGTFNRTASFRESVFQKAPLITSAKFFQNVDFEQCSFSTGDEVTYRNLKKKMEEQHHYWEATQFYGRELAEQRKKQGCLKNFTSLNLFYGIASNYGRWWALPLFWLLVTSVACWSVYWLSGGVELGDTSRLHGWEHDLLDAPAWEQAAFFAIQNLRFSWLFGKELLVARSLPIFLLSVFQSIVSVVLIAMLIISIRRRFRIQ